MTRIVSIVEAKTVTGPAKNLLRFASENRGRVDFQFITYARAKSEAEVREYTNGFIEACQHAGLPVSVIWERGRFDLRLLSCLTECICSFQPHIVQTHSVKSHLLVSLIRKQISAPWIAFHHGYTAEDLKMRIFNRIDRFSLPRAGQVVTVCEAFADSLAGQGVEKERIQVLHNSLDPAWAQHPGVAEEATAIREGLPDGGVAPVLLCVGRFSTEKGHETLLEAVRRLRDARAADGQSSGPFTLLLIGDGGLRAAMEAKARELQLDATIVFAGHKRYLPPYFAAADVLVLPSLSEGSPNVLLEAMAAELPIVATNVGGVKEIVTDGETALLVPSSDPVQLAAAIEQLIENPLLRRRLANRAHQRLIDCFSPAAYDERLLGLYQAMLEPPVAEDLAPLAAAGPG